MERPQEVSGKIRVPFPELQEIPKPPVFNLQFNFQPKQMIPQQQQEYPSGLQQGYPTFSNNFPMVAVKNYDNYDVSDVESYSYIHQDNDRSMVKS